MCHQKFLHPERHICCEKGPFSQNVTDRGGTGRQGTDPENPSSIGPPFLQQTHPTPSEREAAQMLGHTGAPRLPGGGGVSVLGSQRPFQDHRSPG